MTDALTPEQIELLRRLPFSDDEAHAATEANRGHLEALRANGLTARLGLRSGFYRTRAADHGDRDYDAMKDREAERWADA